MKSIHVVKYLLSDSSGVTTSSFYNNKSCDTCSLLCCVWPQADRTISGRDRPSFSAFHRYSKGDDEIVKRVCLIVFVGVPALVERSTIAWAIFERLTRTTRDGTQAFPVVPLHIDYMYNRMAYVSHVSATIFVVTCLHWNMSWGSASEFARLRQDRAYCSLACTVLTLPTGLLILVFVLCNVWMAPAFFGLNYRPTLSG